MNREIDIECIIDRGHYQVYQTTETFKDIVKFCDCCHNQIEDGKALSNEGEDFCITCYLNGDLTKYLMKSVGLADLQGALLPLLKIYNSKHKK